MSLPAMPPQRINSVGKILELLKRRNIAFAMLGVMFTFAGALPLSLTCDHFSRLTLGLACVNCRYGNACLLELVIKRWRYFSGRGQQFKCDFFGARGYQLAAA
jgi:hypothetical protein